MFQDLIDLFQKISQGESDAIEESGMQDSVIGKLSAKDIRAEHYKACVLQTSAEILGMNMLDLMCKDYINILNVLVQKYHKFVRHEITLEPEDYADTMQELVRELSDKLLPLSKAFSKGEKEDAVALPHPDPRIDENSNSPDATETRIQLGTSQSSSKDDAVALPHPDPSIDENSDSADATETRVQPGSSKSSSNYGRKLSRESSPAPNRNSENKSKSLKKTKSEANTSKAIHYGKWKCPLC